MSSKVITMCVIVLFLGACKSTDKMSQNNTAIKNVACGNIHIDMGKPHIDWFKEKPTVLNNSDKVIVLPKTYSVYSINKQQVSTFFAALGTDGTKLETVLPLPNDCISVRMEKDSIVSEQVKKMYPNTKILKGEAAPYAVALAFDGTKLSGQVKNGDAIYVIMPVENNGVWYSIVYEKDQTMQANKPNVYNEKSEGVILKNRVTR